MIETFVHCNRLIKIFILKCPLIFFYQELLFRGERSCGCLDHRAMLILRAWDGGLWSPTKKALHMVLLVSLIRICKPFMELAEDTDILKAIVFEKGSDSEHDESFWQINGLLNKCARAGNMSASHILLTELVWMLQDFLIDSQEIGDLIVGMKSAVIVEKG
ncbi:uncharacterized protein LOC114283889 isoform X5 [Camellia sinensis]|uniref:uncharacterized protein LOC114283889 isoform X5 n=1 Tax=Camellia sinensis TaxID=4442 RepID=UPI00103565C5|nr:uncharacterized protein LOC114283889 isoform X5 [Camellia sinensis]